MSYSDEEVALLKKCVAEIIDEKYFSTLHELKKKLAIALAKERENEEALGKYEKLVQAYKKCHECHKINAEFKYAATQVREADIEVEVEKYSNTLNRDKTRSNNEPSKLTKQPVKGDSVKMDMTTTSVKTNESPIPGTSKQVELIELLDESD